MSAADYSKVLSKEKQIYLTIADDDGIVQEAKFRTKKNEAEAVYSEWHDINLDTGSFTLSEDGEQLIEFQIKDASGKTFSSVETDSWDKVKINGTDFTALYTTIDNTSPEVSIKKVKAYSKENKAWDSEWTDEDSFIKIIGGDISKIQLMVEATDFGSGIDNVKAEVKIGETSVEDSGITVTQNDDFYIVEIPCNKAGWDGVLKTKIIATDKADRTNYTEKTFNIDNTAPGITVSSPSRDSEQSGSITAFGGFTERVKLSYAISPMETDPDTYNSSTVFTVTKKNSSTGTVTNNNVLPAKDKADNAIALPEGKTLKDLCEYKEYDTEQTNSFYIYFDDLESVGNNHTGLLNSWLKKLAITTEQDINNTDITKCFDDIVTLYLHLRAVDTAGNVNHEAYPILVDPQGNRPKIEFSYPKLESSTLGGKINLIGSITGNTSSYTVYLQIDNNNDNVYESSLDGYTLVPIPNLSGEKGIAIPVNGTVWSKKINENGEFNPGGSSDTTNPINIRVYAVDENNLISSAKTRHIEIDNKLLIRM